jgi:hypothetical protein
MLVSMLGIIVSFVALSWLMFIGLSFYQWFWGHDGRAPWKYEHPTRDVWR